MKDYRRRIVDDELALRLEAQNGVEKQQPLWNTQKAT